MANGVFITLEGGEGSGKSTLLQQLALELQKQGQEVVQTREPGGSLLGNQIRHWLLHQDASLKIGHLAELLLFLAARAQHIEELILPALKRGAIVLCDRFNDSTIAYQGATGEIAKDKVQQLCQVVCRSLNPDLTLFLDVDPKVGLIRTQRLAKEHAHAGELDRIEGRQLDFHNRVREIFCELANQEPDRIQQIDASQSQSAVFEKAWQIVNSLVRRTQKATSSL